MSHPSLFFWLIVFSQQTLSNTSSGKGKLSVPLLSEASGTHFFRKILSGSLPPSGLTINAIPRLPLSYFQKGMTNSVPGGLDYIQLGSRSGPLKAVLFFPQRLVFIPTSALPPFSFSLCFNSAMLWRAWPHTENITGIKPGKVHTVMKY